MIFFSSFVSLVKSLLKIKKQSRKKVGMNNQGCFVDLDVGVQNEIIKRTEHMEY